MSLEGGRRIESLEIDEGNIEADRIQPAKQEVLRPYQRLERRSKLEQ